jgi:hypothetical protein
MIIRAAIAGFVLWLIATLAFRFLGTWFFYPDERLLLGLFIAAPILMIAVTWASMKALNVAPGDQAEAAIGLALPGMVLDVFAVREFASVFPALDPTLDATFGALMLVSYAAMVFAGLLFTRIAPQDERL